MVSRSLLRQIDLSIVHTVNNSLNVTGDDPLSDVNNAIGSMVATVSDANRVASMPLLPAASYRHREDEDSSELSSHASCCVEESDEGEDNDECSSRTGGSPAYVAEEEECLDQNEGFPRLQHESCVSPTVLL